MKKCILIIVLSLLPVLCQAQKATGSLNDYVAQLNTTCPKVLNDGWTVNSFGCRNDSVTVTITVNAESAGYLPMMAAHAEQMKAMWIKQMPQYGEFWNGLVTQIVAAEKNLIVLLRSEDGDKQATFVFTPNELSGKI